VIVIIAIRFFIFTTDYHSYSKNLHDLRRLVLPDSQGHHEAFGLGITFEQLNQYLLQVDGLLFLTSAFFVFFNFRFLGGFFLIVAEVFLLMTKDNPFLHSTMLSSQAERNQKCNDVLKHMSFIGAALLLMSDRPIRPAVVVAK
jgi:hypothetical protein